MEKWASKDRKWYLIGNRSVLLIIGYPLSITVHEIGSQLMEFSPSVINGGFVDDYFPISY